MKLLLDTHTLLWYVSGQRELGSNAQAAIRDSTNEAVVSMASLCEIAIKQSLGKLELHPDIDGLVAKCSFAQIDLLGISVRHVKRLVTLPHHHRDPFDRILAAQALEDGFRVVSCDPALDAYGVQRIW